VCRWWLALGFVLVLLASVACGDDDDDDTSATTASTSIGTGATATTAQSSPPTTGTAAEVPTGLSGDLTVFAAASLTDAFGEMKAQLEDANPDLSITYNFAGSQQLVTQLAEGADADVFASANMTQMKAAQDAGTIDGEPVVFVRNRLAIIVPSDNPADVQEPADLARDGLKLVVANEDVPVGGYTLDMLDKMSADPAFGADFRSKVEANIVSHEDNVKQVVTKVQLGEADAGVVYVSDVTPDVREDVTFIEIPEQYNVIAEYPIAPVADGDVALAQAYIDYLLSAGGQAVLEQWGFTPVED
jgi:molybdate transport system substrate-binding protein